MRLSDCFSDWGGFEKFVAELNRTGELASVEHNVFPVGRSGLKRQIDVLVTHRRPPFGAFRTIIDCKLWNSKVKRSHVDAMVTSMQDLSASRGAFFTTKGFQSGALEFAKQSNVDLFLVRELTDAEWGGRVLNFRLQLFDRSMNSQHFRATCGLMEGRTTLPAFHLKIGSGTNENLLWYADGKPARSLEKCIEDATQEAMQRLAPQIGPSVLPDAETHLHVTNVTAKFEPPRRWTNPKDPSEHVLLHDLSLRLVIRVRQSTFSVDRSKGFPIALAIEDCIAGHAFMVSKKAGDEFVEYTEMSDVPKHDLNSGEFGIQVLLTNWFLFPENELSEGHTV